jgi:hypothetical protein
MFVAAAGGPPGDHLHPANRIDDLVPAGAGDHPKSGPSRVRMRLAHDRDLRQITNGGGQDYALSCSAA